MRTLAKICFVVALAACGQTASPSGAASAEAAEAAAAGGGGEAAYVETCVAEMVAQNPQAQQWAPDQCRQQWGQVVAAGPMAEAILAAAGGTMPSGARLGDLAVEVNRAAPSVAFSWSETGGLIPYEVIAALRERGATVAMIGCAQYGVGEFGKAYSVTPAGGRPFQLSVYDRGAPTANAESFYNVTADLSGRVQTRAQLASDGMEWTPACAY